MLEFCVDITLYFMRVPDSVAAIHCKAGKGRTGTMIICYLIFAGLFDNIDMAFAHYATLRTKNEKGVTIESQKRFIRYFQNLLITKFSRPYVNCIPDIIKYLLSSEQQEKLTLTKNIGLSDMDNFIIMNNIIENLIRKENEYFFTKNFFEINFIEIDNMADRYHIKFKIESLFQKKLEYDKIHPEYVIYDDELNKSKENYVIKDKNRGDDFESSFEVTDRSFSASCLPSENILNRNKFLIDLENKEKSEKTIKEDVRVKEKFNIRLNFENSMTHKHSDILGDNFKINYDIKLAISSNEFKFYFWVNLWYACLDCIASYIIENLIENRKPHHTFSHNIDNEPKKNVESQRTIYCVTSSSNFNKELDLPNYTKSENNKNNKLKEIHLPKKSYKIDSSNNLDSSKNIKYLNDLIEKNDLCIKKFINTEDEKKNDEIVEENKINVNEILKNGNEKRKNFLNSKARAYINRSKKVVELSKINEILIMLKNDDDLNNCISRINLVVHELNQKGFTIKPFDRKNLDLNLGIQDTDKPQFKDENRKIVLTLNYSLMNK